LFLDSAGQLWVGGSGLCRIEDAATDHPRFIYYDLAQRGRIRCITEDSRGNLYIGTGSGIHQLDPNTGGVKLYSVADGLASEPTRALRGRDGALWLGTSHGLSRFVPPQESTPPSVPVLISGLRVAGQAQLVAALGETALAGLEFGPGQNNLQIDYFGLNVDQGGLLRYQFKIEGERGDWGAPVDYRSVNLNLAPGHYRFLVRAISTDGTVTASPASVEFRILPPMWQRWWFIALAGLLVTTAAVARPRRVRRYCSGQRERRNAAGRPGRVYSRGQAAPECVRGQTARESCKVGEAREWVSSVNMTLGFPRRPATRFPRRFLLSFIRSRRACVSSSSRREARPAPKRPPKHCCISSAGQSHGRRV
jgi:hypothetical protein